MGFSVGDEYSGAVAYLLEGASADRRGLVATSMPGFMIAAVAAAVLPVFFTLEETAPSNRG